MTHLSIWTRFQNFKHLKIRRPGRRHLIDLAANRMGRGRRGRQSQQTVGRRGPWKLVGGSKIHKSPNKPEQWRSSGTVILERGGTRGLRSTEDGVGGVGWRDDWLPGTCRAGGPLRTTIQRNAYPADDKFVHGVNNRGCFCDLMISASTSTVHSRRLFACFHFSVEKATSASNFWYTLFFFSFLF